jgi:tropomyosin-1
MAISAGSPSVTSVKSKLQGVLDELEKYRDLYNRTSQELEAEKEKRIRGENDLTSMNRRMNVLEDEQEQLTTKLRIALEKLEEATKSADESERSRRVMDQRRALDEDRVSMLENLLRETSEAATECERKYEEVTRKLLLTETELEKSDGRAEAAELKVKHLQQDMHALSTRLKSMASSTEKYVEREQKYSQMLDEVNARLKASENHSNESDRTVLKLQVEVDRLQDELVRCKLQYQSLRDERSYSREISAI